MTEARYAQKIKMALEKLGWSEYAGEIKEERPLHIGRGGTIRPDLIVSNTSNFQCFIVEIKRPIDMLYDAIYRKQLTSYMRQTKSKYGILVGRKIQVFVDNSSFFRDEPVMVFDLEICPLEQKGHLFTRLFTKRCFGSEEFKAIIQSQTDSWLRKNDTRIEFHNPKTDALKNRRRVPLKKVPLFEERESQPEFRTSESDRIEAILSGWGKKSPWGHITKSKSGRIDACLCVEPGMAVREIAIACYVPTGRVYDHIHNDLAVGKRNGGKAAIIQHEKTPKGDDIYRLIEQ
jgi:hypothetical protein